MAGLQKVAGSRAFIGSRVPYKSTVMAADFAGQSNWLEIGGWQQTGDLGAEQETLSQTLINQNITIYSKGTISFPIMSNTFIPMRDDPGQAAFRVAQRSCKPFAFKIEWGADCGEEGAVTISNASPGVVGWNGHGLAAGTPVRFETTGTLPAPLVAGTTYFVASAGLTSNAFGVSASIGGAAIATTAAGTGVHTAYASEPGETDLFFGFAMFGTKTGGDASATRLLNLPIQPICQAIEI
ncbi:hypothetical protein HOY34_20640 [Xinfangfangia sp. D13-10-4-6]|uniref:hypothetical protein n=1 Tax=Pseudogemmobacter hezensis TaxID=2737662 RepID=UPI0015572252|nr:hypothetical protein [Pseudogemmobacter hezensis]NPD17597.1 hypothetical protein [Pseudogemmobacter hezensis]